MKINYPSEEKRAIIYSGYKHYVIYIGCAGITLYFKNSNSMQAAYGLAITICMISTSLLFSNFMVTRRVQPFWIYLYLIVYLSIELSFLAANLQKFHHGGYVTLLVGGCLFAVMYIWYRSRRIKNRYIEFVRLEHYIPIASGIKQ